MREAALAPEQLAVAVDAAASAAGQPRSWLFILRKPSAIGILLLVGIALFAGLLAPYEEAQIDPINALAPPSLEHLMGTDMFGRDVFSRVLYGTRLSLMIGFTAALIGAVIGVTIGIVAGYAGGVVDSAAMRVIDILLAFPGTLLAMVIVAVLGPSLINLVLAVGIASVPGYARLVRSLALQIRELDYVQAAQAGGAPAWYIIVRHVFPNLSSSVIVYGTLNIATAMLSAAGLGYLGLGSKPPTAEWGLMVADGRETLEIAWWVTTFPGLAILVTTLIVYSFGEALTVALDPKREAR